MTQQGDRSRAHRLFWKKFLDRVAMERPKWTTAQPPPRHYLNMSRGLPGGYKFVNVLLPKELHLKSEVYIGLPREQSKEAFDLLFEKRDVLEQTYGRGLTWERLDHRNGCRIAEYRSGALEDVDAHEEYVEWFLDAGHRMRRALEQAQIYTPR